MSLRDLAPETLIIERRDWRAVLDREYKPVSERLQRAYARMQRNLAPYQQNLTDRLLRDYAANGVLRESDVRRWSEYTRLLARIEIEMDDFAAIARGETAGLAEQMLPLGIDGAEALTVASAGDAGAVIASNFLRPDPEAIVRLIDFVDGRAFRSNWNAFGRNAAQSFADALITSIAQGKNPRVIASMMASWYGFPYSWAENAARTTQIWSYRLANHATYLANDRILDGWWWSSAQDVRTCISCWDRHGEVHPLTDVLNDHHRGRCAPIPLIKGQGRPRPGRVRFESLPEPQQREIMGVGLFDAWKSGDVRWGNFSRPYQDNVFGEMLRAATQKELGIR